jgi:hypothetical protein
LGEVFTHFARWIIKLIGAALSNDQGLRWHIHAPFCSNAGIEIRLPDSAATAL